MGVWPIWAVSVLHHWHNVKFDGDFKGHGDVDFTCKQTLTGNYILTNNEENLNVVSDTYYDPIISPYTFGVKIFFLDGSSVNECTKNKY